MQSHEIAGNRPDLDRAANLPPRSSCDACLPFTRRYGRRQPALPWRRCERIRAYEEWRIFGVPLKLNDVRSRDRSRSTASRYLPCVDRGLLAASTTHLHHSLMEAPSKRVGEKGSERSGACKVVPVDEEDAEPCVMVVDDSSVNRAVVTQLLRRYNCIVTAVDSVKKALQILGSEPNVNMIITDYSMPEMTGYDLLKKVKESPELKQIPVVIMSSENVPTRISRCLEEGAEDFVFKPVRPSDISRIATRTRMLQSN